MLVILGLNGGKWDWFTGLLFLASLGMTCSYTLPALKASRRTLDAFKNSGGIASMPSPPSNRVKDIARDPARKIEAIKGYREETGAGLAEAKTAVEIYIGSL